LFRLLLAVSLVLLLGVALGFCWLLAGPALLGVFPGRLFPVLLTTSSVCPALFAFGCRFRFFAGYFLGLLCFVCCWALLSNFAGWVCPAWSASWCHLLVLLAVSWVCLALFAFGCRFIVLLAAGTVCPAWSGSGRCLPICWLLVGFALLVMLLGVAFKFSWLLTGSALFVLLEGVAFQLLF
jgi:hypothetical protein